MCPYIKYRIPRIVLTILVDMQMTLMVTLLVSLFKNQTNQLFFFNSRAKMAAFQWYQITFKCWSFDNQTALNHLNTGPSSIPIPTIIHKTIFFSVYPTQHSGYHMSLAKMDSAPSSSVVGIHALHTANLHMHANSEASLLKMAELPVPSR